MTSTPPDPDTVVAHAAARAGVAGNPSDALGGAALAVPVAALGVTVRLRPSSRLRFRSLDDPPGWSSVAELVDHTERLGHEGADRLLSAAVVTLHRHLTGGGTPPPAEPFELTWSTTIPRSVGLAGSSALVIATMRALCSWWGVHLEPVQLAELALRAETDELGIAAGWMDRAVQATDTATLVDVAAGGDGPPVLRNVHPRHPVQLLVGWDPSGASPSGRLHSDLRARVATEPQLGALVEQLVQCAHRAADALSLADVSALGEQVRVSCAARRGLGALDDATAALVQAAADCGAPATSAGSGGAVLVVPPQGRADDVAAALAARHIEVVQVHLGGQEPT